MFIHTKLAGASIHRRGDEEIVKARLEDGERDLPVSTWVVDVTPEMRKTLKIGRPYINFSSCRLLGHLSMF